MHGLDWYDYGARYYDAVISQFTTIDPLAEKYYSTSPYAYCAGNPVMFVDPDGRDIWEVDGSGNVVNRIKDKTQDAFYMVDKDGNRTFTTDADGNKHYNTISFEYGTVESHKNISIGKNESMDIFKVRGDDNGTKLFEFMATNVAPSLVEFSHIKTGVEGDKGLNFVTTSHDVRKERSMGKLWFYQLRYGYTLREINHSHPTNNEAGKSDKGAANDINSIYDRSRRPTFNIFFVPERKYIPFN